MLTNTICTKQLEYSPIKPSLPKFSSKQDCNYSNKKTMKVNFSFLDCLEYLQNDYIMVLFFPL